MSEMTNGVAVPAGAGSHVIQINYTSGTITFSMSLDDGDTYQDITDASYSADADAILDLPECLLKAAITGTATVLRKRIRYPV